MKRSSPRRQSFSIAREGQGIVNHAGAAVLRELADRFEYTSTLCDGLDPLRARRATHHPGAVLTDLAVSIADGGDCLRELAVLHDQPDLFGHVASVPTASRVISRLTRGHLEQLRAARRRMRDQVWRKAGRPELLVLDIDATLVTSHSEKEEASGNYKHGFGFHPLACFLEATGDALSALLRGGSAGSNTARDHIEVFRLACDQLPEWVQEEPMLVGCDSAGASHDFLNAVRAREKAKFWVGFELRDGGGARSHPQGSRGGLGSGHPSGRRGSRGRRGLRARPARPLWLADGHPRHLPPRASAPGSSALLHRSPGLAFPGLHHRPGGRGHALPRPSPRPLRGPDPMCQGDRAPRLPLPGLRAEPDLARVGARRSRPALPLPPRRPHR